jgi:hypothetical protein
MDMISAQSRDHLRQTIIDEIKSLEASIRALKSCRNTLALSHACLSKPLSRYFASGQVLALQLRADDMPQGVMCLAVPHSQCGLHFRVGMHSVIRQADLWDPQVAFSTQILQLPPEYDMNIEALISPVLAALHNFIQQYDPEEIHMYDNQPFGFRIGLHPKSTGELGTGLASEMVQANERRDKITGDKWDQYQYYLESRVVCDR